MIRSVSIRASLIRTTQSCCPRIRRDKPTTIGTLGDLEWRLRGARVELGEPDLRLFRDEKTFLVACKRPASENAVHSNIRGAISQLNGNLRLATEDVWGVIAISLTKIFNAGTKYWSGTLGELSALMYQQTRRYKPAWQASNADPRICAILFHVATPSDIGQKVDVSLASQLIGEPVKHVSAGTIALREHIKDMKAVEDSTHRITTA